MHCGLMLYFGGYQWPVIYNPTIQADKVRYCVYSSAQVCPGETMKWTKYEQSDDYVPNSCMLPGIALEES